MVNNVDVKRYIECIKSIRFNGERRQKLDKKKEVEFNALCKERVCIEQRINQLIDRL